MTEHQTLDSYLSDYAGDDELRLAVAHTVQSIANACCAIAEVIALGPLAGSLGQQGEQNADGDVQAELDIRANEIVLDELEDAPGRHEAARDVARSVAQTPAYRQTRRQRKQVEMLFAHMKRVLKMDRLRLRGLVGVHNRPGL